MSFVAATGAEPSAELLERIKADLFREGDA